MFFHPQHSPRHSQNECKNAQKCPKIEFFQSILTGWSCIMEVDPRVVFGGCLGVFGGINTCFRMQNHSFSSPKLSFEDPEDAQNRKKIEILTKNSKVLFRA